MVFATALLLSFVPSEVQEFQVSGLTRQATIVYGTQRGAAPVIFAFHGHGGNMRYAARAFDFSKVWPEATVVYMQGIPTVGQITDPDGKKNGWGYDGRDLKFFDAVYDSLARSGRMDRRHVYSMGHSNGGAFTYYLWSKRGDLFAAVAPASASLGIYARSVPPKPAFIVGGTQDPLVKFTWQQKSIERVIQTNGVAETRRDGLMTWYEAANKPPVVTYLFEGGHNFARESLLPMAEFFKRF